MAKRVKQPKELVRLSPLQFSMSISIVVVMLAAAGLAGYYYGLKRSDGNEALESESSIDQETSAEIDTQKGEADTSVTFYSALTEPRKTPPPQDSTAPGTRKEVPAQKTAIPANGSVSAHPRTGSGSIILQVASYKEMVPAQKLLNELSKEGYGGTVVRADLDQRGVWYRVRIGPYETEKVANTVLDTLRRERKLKGYIVK